MKMNNYKNKSYCKFIIQNLNKIIMQKFKKI